MPFCVLRNDISKNEVYVNRLARRPVVAQSNSTWLTFTGRCCRRGGKTCPICTSYRALINCRLHIRDEPVGNLGKKSTRSYAVANHSCWTRGNMSSAVGSYSSFGIRL